MPYPIGMAEKLAIQGGQPVRTSEYPHWPMAGAREEELLLEVIRSNQWGGYNKLVGEFEKLFGGAHDVKHAVACVNGTVAIEMALHATGIGPGDEVIVPAHSFVATSAAVSREGAIPVFVDIERDTYNLDPERIPPAVSPRTKAVIVVHFGGVMANMDRIQSVASAHNLVVIEDAAHAHGAEWEGKRSGSFGLAGAFSFQNTKVMTAGEGGIMTTSDDEVAASARSYANCGRRPGHGGFDHFKVASNYRMTGFQAAVLTAQLEKLPEQVRRRQANVEVLTKAVTAAGVRFQAASTGANLRSYYMLTGAVDESEFGVNRDEFVEALEAEGIPCGVFYDHPLYGNPMYQAAEHRVEPCPVAEEVCTNSFWLPLKTLMGSEEDALDVARAIDKIHAAFTPSRAPSKVSAN